MDLLGHLAWWRVSNVQLPHSEAETLLPSLGFETPPPARVLPVDAFRRLANEVSERYEVDGQSITLSLHLVEYPRRTSPMLVRHLVRHNKTSGEFNKVGEAVFYKPPKGQHSKARLRIDVHSTEPQVRAFGARLRAEYDGALSNLDSQAVRRLIRLHLTKVKAVSLSGPYFFHDAEHVAPLAALFEHLGADCVFHQMPVVDDEGTRQMLATVTKEEAHDG